MSREYYKGKYHCTVDLLFDWFWLDCFANKNKNCQLSYIWFQTSQTGGQWYSDTSPLSIPRYEHSSNEFDKLKIGPTQAFERDRRNFSKVGDERFWNNLKSHQVAKLGWFGRMCKLPLSRFNNSFHSNATYKKHFGLHSTLPVPCLINLFTVVIKFVQYLRASLPLFRRKIHSGRIQLCLQILG